MRKTNFIQKQYLKKKNFFASFETKEEFKTLELLTLRDILEDLMFEQGLGNKKETLYKRINRRLNCVNSVLLGTENDITVTDGCFSRTTSYGFLHKFELGRIFPKHCSVSQFPRDIRYHLFKGDNNYCGEYADYDLKNCHPTILYEFVSMHTSLNTPCLQELVLNRYDFNKRVSSQLKDKNNVKIDILIALYSDNFKSRSNLLRNLHSEVVEIRKEIQEYVKNDERYNQFVGSRSVTIQSYYCMTKESETLLALKTFLHDKLGNSSDGLHFIPFFDGVFMRHEKQDFNKRLYDYVVEFNLSQRYLVFEKKAITLPDDCIVTDKMFKEYLHLRRTLNQLSVRQFDKLVAKLNIEPFTIPESLLIEINNDLNQVEEKSAGLLPTKFFHNKHFYMLGKYTREFRWKVKKKFLSVTKGDPLLMKKYVKDLGV